nr:nuclear transport factor 2 family protein [Pseudofrankia sp. BMG5.36]
MRTEAPGPAWLTAYNKKLVTAFVDRLLVTKDLSAIDAYVGPEYDQHNPNIPDGVAGVKTGLGAYFTQFPQLQIIPKRIVAEGDLVAVHSNYVDTPGTRGQAVVDLFRVRDGRIVEHWDAVQEVPESSANGNTMF